MLAAIGLGCGPAGSPESAVLEAMGAPDAPLPAGPGPSFSSCDWRSGSGCSPVPTSCAARGPLPAPGCTPGALNPEVTPATLGATICLSGWTATVRPPTTYTGPLKLALMAAYQVGSDTSAYELDHLVPLELGGAPADAKNLWPEAHAPTPGSFEKDRLENYLKGEVCAGRLALAVAQQEIAADWVMAWQAAGSP